LRLRAGLAASNARLHFGRRRRGLMTAHQFLRHTLRNARHPFWENRFTLTGQRLLAVQEI
jgi:hypothetical protein